MSKNRYYSLSVLGQPITKKRARTGGGVSKTGKAYRWAYTPDDWFEEMVSRAFGIKYPDALPFGYECCKYDDKKQRYVLDTKNYNDMDLPKLELVIVFYFNGGKVGDLDNYIKAIKDALNGVAFIDDRQFKHYEPFIISLDENTYSEFLEEDEVKLNNCPTLERVDFLIREYEPINNRIKSIRKFFNSDPVAIDYTTRYYDNDYRNMKKERLLEIADEYNIPLPSKATKDEIVELFIQDDLIRGGKNEGKIKKAK